MEAAAKLAEIVAEFAELDPRERLEMLLDYAEGLAPLPERFHAARDAGQHRVHECQTPVFLWVEVHQGRVRLFAHVAPEAPTVKGFVGVLATAYEGETPGAVLDTPGDLVARLGLVEALGMQRMRGLSAILERVRRGVREAAATAGEADVPQ